MANQEQIELLEQGVEEWNRWREKYPSSEVNLSGANLWGANLIRADLWGANLWGADLSKANLSGANLSGANLSRANLSGTDLSGADLSGADLSGATLIFGDDRFGVAIIQNTVINRKWRLVWEIVNHGAEGRDLRGTDLSGANLSGANLSRANLSGADLSGANLSRANLSGTDLSGADLSGANLSRADLSNVLLTASQLLRSNLTAANLTGVCIQDWNINSATQLNDVICECVYLRREWSEQERKYLLSDRRPSDPNRIFAPGELITLIQQAHETVDLIFTDGIDWQAFFQSFQNLRSKYDDLSIQAIEKKSGGAFVIRLEVPPEADKAAIESQAKQLYEGKIRQLEERVSEYKDEVVFLRQSLLQSNTNIERIVETMAENQSPKYDFRGSSIGNFVDTAQAGSHQSNIQYINMSQDLTQAAQQIQDLLQQLQNHGIPVETAQQQVATDMAKQAETDSTMMGKMVLWGKAMANKASETTVSEAAKMVLTLALKAAGIPLP